MRIKALSPTVANQIAAGEVIENPASVVKELLENALDAKASVISIDIGFGGLNQIKISDNGAGIDAEDLPLAIAPHATSKLTQLSDLSTLTSMGFRGEALASIASVSRIAILSKPAGQTDAMMLEAEGDVTRLSPCARNQGTSIDVRDLFYNAPVRRQFLKSERSEYLAIEHIVKRFAMSAPAIQLSLKHNGKLMLELPAATDAHRLQVRIQRLLGKAFMDSAIYLDVERAGMHLRGWVSSSLYQRSQNDKQWIYLNQRMVKDKLIQHAFKQAYENRLYPGRYPACLLYMTMPTADVDVNVHPTKHEVRFQQPRLVHDFIASQVSCALSTSSTDTGVEVLDPVASSTVSEPVKRDIEFSRTCEPAHIPSPQSGEWQSTPMQNASWLVLNQDFGLIAWQSQHYVFNIQRAQHHRYLWLIEQQTWPLTSRPLLVPFGIDIAHPLDNRLWVSLEAARNFGIDMVIEDNRLMVRTIPVCMPQLEVKSYLMRLLRDLPGAAEMPLMLADCQPATVHEWDRFEKNALAEFVVQQLADGHGLFEWCVPLDLERCRGLFHE